VSGQGTPIGRAARPPRRPRAQSSRLCCGALARVLLGRVIRALSPHDVRIARIVATSSGALTGPCWRRRCAVEIRSPAGDRWPSLWRDHAGGTTCFTPAFRDRCGLTGCRTRSGCSAAPEHVPAGPCHDPRTDQPPARSSSALAAVRPIVDRRLTIVDSVCATSTARTSHRGLGLERVVHGRVRVGRFPVALREIDGLGGVDAARSTTRAIKWQWAPRHARLRRDRRLSMVVSTRRAAHAAPDFSCLAPMPATFAAAGRRSAVSRPASRTCLIPTRRLTALDRMVAAELNPGAALEIKQVLAWPIAALADIVWIRPITSCGSPRSRFLRRRARR